MLTTIRDLYLRDTDGFWLNILSNVPFVIFELIIIVLLLPITMEAIRRRNNRPARRAAFHAIFEPFHIATMRFHSYHASSIHAESEGKDESDSVIASIKSLQRLTADLIPVYIPFLEGEERAAAILFIRQLESFLEAIFITMGADEKVGSGEPPGLRALKKHHLILAQHIRRAGGSTHEVDGVLRWVQFSYDNAEKARSRRVSQRVASKALAEESDTATT